MFAESFLPNLALFVAGQFVAWFYLRTGRWWLGGVIMAVLWIAADWALVAKFVFAEGGQNFRVALIVMQLVAISSVLLLGFEQWRRRWSATAKQRGVLFGEAMTLYLRGDHDAAGAAIRRLIRCDPWDAAAWLLLGNVHHRRDEQSAARRCYRRGKRVDGKKEYHDFVDLRLALRPSAGGGQAEPPSRAAVNRASPAPKHLSSEPQRS